MILTEEEAKTKRCQESFPARITTDGGGNIYKPVSREETGADFHEISAAPRNCIGSACMAWRWLAPADGEVIVINGQLVLTGYCGKAGRP